MSSHNPPQGQPHDRFQGGRLGEPRNDINDAPVSLTQKMLSATVGSLITSLLVTPLDVVRVRLQSQSISPLSRPSIPNMPQAHSFSNIPPNMGLSSCCREVFWVSNNASYCVATPELNMIPVTPNKSVAVCAAEESQRKVINSTYDGLRKIYQNEGLFTLWRGLSPTLAMAIPANVLYFASYDWLRYSRRSPFQSHWIPDNYVPLVAGSSARVSAAIVVAPIEMFRTRMQAAQGKGNWPETIQGVQNLMKAKGYQALWTGLGLTLWRDVPFSALYWWGYEECRHLLRQARGQPYRRRQSSASENHTTTLTDSFIAGATSGAVASFLTTPFDVGKTRQQVVNPCAMASLAAKSPVEMSMPRLLWDIFKKQGMEGLFRGWAARCLKVAPACAIMISSYEVGKKLAGGMNEGKASH